MNKNIISAVFDSRSEAELAVGELRGQGIDSAKLSIIGREEDRTTVTDGSGETAKEGVGDTVKGALGGAGMALSSVLPPSRSRASVRSPRRAQSLPLPSQEPLQSALARAQLPAV